MKRQDHYDEVREIFNAMYGSEREKTHLFISTFDRNSSRTISKQLKMLQLWMEDPDISREAAMDKLDMADEQYQVNKFFTKLKDKVLEALLLEINLVRSNIYSESFKMQADTRKKLTAGRIFISRGLIANAERLMEEVLLRCKRYELYEEAAEAVRLLQQTVGLERGRRTFRRLGKNVKAYQELAEHKRIAEDWYTRYEMELQRKNPVNDSEAVLKKGLAQLEKLTAEIQSDTINYFYLYLKYNFEINKQKYELAQKTLKSLATLLENSVAVNNTQRLLLVWKVQGEVELRQGNYVAAEEIYKKYVEQLSPYSRDHFTATKYYLRSKMYLHKYDEVQAIALRMLEVETPEEFQAERDEIRYLLASANFQQKLYPQVLTSVEQISDNSNSLLNQYRLTLGAMAALELLHNGDSTMYDTACQFAFRLKNIRPDRRRDKVINRLMLKTRMFEFTYDRVYRRNTSDFNLLESDDENLIWEPNGYEFVPFNEWFDQMLRKTGYRVEAR